MSKIFGFCTSLRHLQLSTFRFGCEPKFIIPKNKESSVAFPTDKFFGRKFLFILFQQSCIVY